MPCILTMQGIFFVEVENILQLNKSEFCLNLLRLYHNFMLLLKIH